MPPSISVIIPIKNNPEQLKQCLESLTLNNYKNREIIIVDDCSDCVKAVKELAAQFACKFLRNDICLGPLKSRLKGLSMAKYEIVAFIDSDCLAPENWLKNIALFLSKDIAGIGGVYEYAQNNSMFSRFLCLFSTYWFSQWKKGKTDFLLGGNCAYWTNKVKEFSRFQGIALLKTLNSGDDTLLNLEIAKKYELVFIPELKVKHIFFSLKQYLKRQVNWAFSRTIISFFYPQKKLLATRDFSIIELLLQLISCIGMLIAVFGGRIAQINFCAGFFLFTHIRPLIYFFRKTKRPVFIIYSLMVLFSRDIMYLAGIIKAFFVMISEILVRLGELIVIGFNLINPFRPSKLHFFVTKNCNASCKYCFNRECRDADREQPDLDLKQIKTISKKIGFISYLIISGGEPFMRDDIADICALFYANAFTRFFVLTTNGFFSDKIIRTVNQFLADYPRARLVVQVSLDSIGPDNDKIKNLAGAYENALDTINQLNCLKQIYPKLLVNISTTINECNSKQIEQMVDRIKKENLADFHFVSPLRGFGPQAGLRYMEIDRYFSILNSIDQNYNQRIAEKSMFKFIYKIFYNQAVAKMKSILLNECSDNKCSAWKKIAVIDWQANVLFCELHPEIFGNLLKEKSLLSVRKSVKFNKRAKNIITGHCYCNWGCAVVADIVSNPWKIFGSLWGKRMKI